MLNEEERLTLKKAIQGWGENFQLEMVIEECSELILAIQHAKRGRHENNDALIEECADVLIVCEQMSIILGEDKVHNVVREKMERLARKVASCNPNLETIK
jgi:NTP pyrophosphatase (non-canonical NTP hydrolase)